MGRTATRFCYRCSDEKYLAKENSGAPSDRVYPLTRQDIRSYQGLAVRQHALKAGPADDRSVEPSTDRHGESGVPVGIRMAPPVPVTRAPPVGSSYLGAAPLNKKGAAKTWLPLDPPPSGP